MVTLRLSAKDKASATSLGSRSSIAPTQSSKGSGLSSHGHPKTRPLQVRLPSEPQGLRHNVGKVRYALISPFALAELSRICTDGAEKYAVHNWALGLKQADTYDSLMRHLEARRRGEIYDSESGRLHTAHVFWNAMALCHFDALDTVELDDLTWYSDNGGWVHPSLSAQLDVDRNRDHRNAVRVRQNNEKAQKVKK